MINYLIGREGHREPLWVVCVVVGLIIMVFEVIDFLISLF